MFSPLAPRWRVFMPLLRRGRWVLRQALSSVTLRERLAEPHLRLRQPEEPDLQCAHERIERRALVALVREALLHLLAQAVAKQERVENYHQYAGVEDGAADLGLARGGEQQAPEEQRDRELRQAQPVVDVVA